VRERAPVPGVRYTAFCDPSGGSVDAFTLAIAHMEGEQAVLDCLRARTPPFSPDAVVKEFCDTLRTYGVRKVRGDRYGGLWPRERFQTHGVEYEPSVRNRSEIYLATLPLILSERVRLLDDAKLRAQLAGLERKTGREGKETVDHGVGQHDDLANSAAGALAFASPGGFGRRPTVDAPIDCTPTGNPWAMGGDSALAPDRERLNGGEDAESWWRLNGWTPPSGPLG